MKEIKIIIAAILILAVSATAYIYFKKEPVESIPKRATLVFNYYIK